MPATLPRSAHRAWGDEAAAEVEGWIDERTVSRTEFQAVLTRLDVLERGMAEVKSAIGEQRRETLELRREMNQRFDHLNERFDSMNTSINERFDNMNQGINERFDNMNNSINERFDNMNNSINERFDNMDNSINERFDHLHEAIRVQTRWSIGILALFGTLITVLMAISVFSA